MQRRFLVVLAMMALTCGGRGEACLRTCSPSRGQANSSPDNEQRLRERDVRHHDTFGFNAGYVSRSWVLNDSQVAFVTGFCRVCRYRRFAPIASSELAHSWASSLEPPATSGAPSTTATAECRRSRSAATTRDPAV